MLATTIAVETQWIAAGGSVLVVALLALTISLIRLRNARGKARESTQQLDELRRSVTRRDRREELVTRFVRDFPDLSRRLYARQSARQLSQNLLGILGQIFQPEEAIVVLRRRSTRAGKSSYSFRITDVLHGSRNLAVGIEILAGEGELGLVVESQTLMERRDFDQLSPAVRQRIKSGGLPHFEVFAAAPMVVAGQLLGILAISRPSVISDKAVEVLRMIAELGALSVYNASAYGRLKRQAEVDQLTGILNKASIVKSLSEELVALDNHQTPLTVLLFDIDHFKNYNDRNGHLAGDKLLSELAALVTRVTREEDLFGRFGGEEFLLILPDTAAPGAFTVGEKVRTSIAEADFAHAEGQPMGCLSISGGLASYPSHADNSTRLLKLADEALYRAKERGRNRIEVAPPIGVGDQGTS